MVIHRRIETQEAAALRSARQHFAAPGGSHDRLVAFLAKVLPMGVGVIAALMVITPLSPRGEISFLLDRNKVATAEDRLRVDDAMYRGSDNDGRPFSLTAGSAVQRSADVPRVELTDLTARMRLSGGPAVLLAPAGRYDIERQLVAVDGAVRFATSDGYRMTVSNVSIDLPRRVVFGTGGVEGAIPAGTFSADTIRADLEARVLTLAGNARLRMVPGQLRMP